jgi:exodeoxyribonuclease V alpha subunit
MSTTTPEHKSMTEEISGLIERVTFHNDESGFCVLRVRVRGHRDEITVIGSLPSVTAGEWLVAEGWWVRDKERGLQFKAKSVKTEPPTTVDGIERYLGGGSVKGIGPVLAKKLVERFGAEVLGIIETRAADLESVDGIGPKRRERIAHAWQEAKQVREIMLFLHSHGVSTSRAVRMFKAYGERAIEKVQNDRTCWRKTFTGSASRPPTRSPRELEYRETRSTEPERVLTTFYWKRPRTVTAPCVWRT